jgi:hypothetical protein
MSSRSIQLPNATAFVRKHGQLPLQVAPFAAETLESYLWRLSARNLLARHCLPKLARGTDFRRTLAELTGYSERNLAAALPELRKPSDVDRWPHLAGLASQYARVRRACTLCAATRVRAQQRIVVFASHEQLICSTHHRWLGNAETETVCRTQFSIATCPDIARANRAHKRLIRRWGRGPVRTSFYAAQRCLDKWSQWREVLTATDIQHRRRRLGVTDHHRYPHPRLVAALYPSAVALTEVILAQRKKAAESKRMTREIVAAGIAEFQRRVVPTLEPGGAWDPYLLAIRENWLEPANEVETGRQRGSSSQR